MALLNLSHLCCLPWEETRRLLSTCNGGPSHRDFLHHRPYFSFSFHPWFSFNPAVMDTVESRRARNICDCQGWPRLTHGPMGQPPWHIFLDTA